MSQAQQVIDDLRRTDAMYRLLSNVKKLYAPPIEKLPKLKDLNDLYR